MKKEKEYRIPLSDVAVKLLESLPRYEGNKYVANFGLFELASPKMA